MLPLPMICEINKVFHKPPTDSIVGGEQWEYLKRVHHVINMGYTAWNVFISCRNVATSPLRAAKSPFNA